MSHHQPFEIIGFHSCDKNLGLKLLSGKDKLKPSKNSWDWLGSGIYFWEQNPTRALDYAVDCANDRQYFNGKIETPFIIGAIIQLGNCLNLVEAGSSEIVKQSYKGLKRWISEEGGKMPRNKRSNRALDCAVIEYVHYTNNKAQIQQYDTVRSAFQEGNRLYAGSNFTERLHLEICVRTESMIKGYFLPLPIEKYNPYYKKFFIKKASKNPIKKG